MMHTFIKQVIILSAVFIGLRYVIQIVKEGEGGMISKKKFKKQA